MAQRRRSPQRLSVLLVPAARGATLSFQTTKTRLLVWLLLSFICIGIVAVQLAQAVVRLIVAPVEVPPVQVQTGPDYEGLWHRAMEENEELRQATLEQAQEFAQTVERFRRQVLRFHDISGLPLVSDSVSEEAPAARGETGAALGGRGGPWPRLAVSRIPLPQGLMEADGHLGTLSRLVTAMDNLNVHLAGRRELMRRTPLLCPLEGRWVLTDSFGWRRHPITGQRERHEGIDMAAPSGTPVLAPADGVVTFAGRHFGYGRMVQIAHGTGLLPESGTGETRTFATRFGHLSRILVEEGDEVHRGQEIGRVGTSGYTTGPHLHYEVWVNGAPVDPTPFVSDLE